jgi:signal transduction histidine kinase
VNEIRVLIADDDRSVRETIAGLLALKKSVRVVATAGDATEAISQATESLPDVAILDVNMPGGGPWAARQLRQASPNTKVIALSAHSDRATVSDMLQSGAVGYLVKGATPTEVIAAVEGAAAGVGSLSPEITLDVIRDLAEARDRAEDLAEELGILDETKRRIIAILSHELFTPITVIQGVARTLAAMGPQANAEDLETLSSSVARASERLRRLVANIDSAAHLDRHDGARVKLQPMLVDDLLAETLGEFDSERGRVRTHIDDVVTGKKWNLDPDLARRALVSVIENALALSGVAPVDVVARNDGGSLVVAVSDRGPGVPPEKRTIIFEALRQADDSSTRSHQGLGLGLYLARRILTAHGGGIELLSREGGGSTFELRFPA